MSIQIYVYIDIEKKVLDMGKKYGKIECNITEMRKILKSEILWETKYEGKYTILFKIILTS